MFVRREKNPFIPLVKTYLWTVYLNYYNVPFSGRGSSAAAPRTQRDFSSSIGYGRGGSRSQQTLSLLTEHVNKKTHTHAELIRKTITPPFKMFQSTAVRMTSNFPLFHFMSHGIQMRRLMMPFNGIYKCYLSNISPQPVISDNSRHFIKAASY